MLLAFSTPWFVIVVPIWITCYGLGLLATRHFAPTSLLRLGWAFVLGGLGAFCHMLRALSGEFGGTAAGADTITAAWHHLFHAQFLMAITFGLFHIIYAACTWPRKTAGDARTDV